MAGVHHSVYMDGTTPEVKKTIESQERIYNTINREYFGYQRLL
jgi:hypothetical protein